MTKNIHASPAPRGPKSSHAHKAWATKRANAPAKVDSMVRGRMKIEAFLDGVTFGKQFRRAIRAAEMARTLRSAA